MPKYYFVYLISCTIFTATYVTIKAGAFWGIICASVNFFLPLAFAFFSDDHKNTEKPKNNKNKNMAAKK